MEEKKCVECGGTEFDELSRCPVCHKRQMQENVIRQMREAAWRLIEATKTANGKLSNSGRAASERTMAYQLQRWASELEGKELKF